jgi:hypothetical protein
MGVGGLDQRAEAGAFVAGQVVHDDNVAGFEFGSEHLADLDLEPVAIDRPVGHR